MKFWKVLTLILMVLGFAAMGVARFTAWTSPAVLTGVMLLGAPVVAALVLVAFFEWRARFAGQAIADEAPDEEPLRAA